MTIFNRPISFAGLTWFTRALGGPGGAGGPSVPLVALAIDVNTPVGDDHPFPTKLPVDQDPVFDHDSGAKAAAVTASVIIFTPPAGCKFARFDCTVDTFIRTDDQAAADDGKSVRVLAGVPEVLPVKAGVKVRAFAATASAVRVTPMKVR